MREIFINRLLENALDDPRIVLITGDLGYKVLDQYREKIPKQFLNAGVAEQNMIGVATGLALEGYNVFVYSIGNFPTLRCLEHVRNDICYHEANVKIVSIGTGFSYGAHGVSHFATEDVSIMRALPKLTICSPGCDWEADHCTQELVKLTGPGYLRLDKSSAGNTMLPNENFALSKNRILRRGSDLTMVTTGGILRSVLLASDLLSQAGYSATVISVPTIKPLDIVSLLTAAKETKGMLVVEEHTVDGGLGSLVAENLLDSGISPKFFKRLGLRSDFPSIIGSQDFLRKYYKLDVDGIVHTACSLLR